MGVSNNVTAVVNFAALLCSIPIIGAGIWLASKQDNECVHLVRWPVIILGVLVLLVSLAGFVGAYWNHQCLLAAYLFAMAVLIVLLLALLVFAFAVTRPDGSYDVPGRAYKEYRLAGFSSWLRDRVTSAGSWAQIRTCLSAADVCGKLGQRYLTADQFFQADLTPLQSGCCNLQAPHGVRVRVRESDGVDKPGEPGGGRGLHRVEQRADAAVLRLQLLQGRAAGQPEVRVEEGQHRPHHRRRRPHLGLPHRLQRLQERPDRGPLPPLQAGLRLESSQAAL